MDNTSYLRLWVLLELSVFSLACVFPDPLPVVPVWQTQVRQAGNHVGSVVTFSGATMVESTFHPLGVRHVTRDCIQVFESNKFLFRGVSSTEDASMEVYQCVQLTPVSTNVVLLRSSAVVTSINQSDTLCLDDNLTTSAWPLTSSTIAPISHTLQANLHRTCGMQGGFDFRLFVNEHNLELCSEHWLKSRLEVDCEDDSAITIDFRTFYCQGSLDMSVVQRLECLGSWTQDNYTFSVVSNNGGVWPKVWLLRFPEVIPAETFDIVISPTVQAITSPDFAEVRNHFKFLAIQSDYPTTCEDEAYNCDICDIERGTIDYCHKSCTVCDSDPQEKTFNVSVQGDWKEIGAYGTQYITVSNSMIYADGFQPLMNLDLPGSQATGHRHALVSLYKNGCKPRYLCVEIVPHGEVLEYRQGNMLKWPHRRRLTAQDVCANTSFSDQDSQTDTPFRLLVRSISQSREMESVHCGIHGYFPFVLKENNSVDCVGSLHACDSRDTFTVDVSADCSTRRRVTYQCIGTFQRGATKVLVTQTEHDPDKIDCWIFNLFPEDSGITVYKFYPSDCNDRTMFQSKYLNGTAHQLELFMLEVFQLNTEASCFPETTQPQSTPPVTTLPFTETSPETTSTRITGTQPGPTDPSGLSSDGENVLTTLSQQMPEVGRVSSAFSTRPGLLPAASLTLTMLWLTGIYH